MIYIIIFAMVFLLSLKKRDQMDTEYAGKEKGLYLRGFSAASIILRHMVWSYEPYVSLTAACLIKFLVPSAVCLFFFYSGYGVMYSYKKKGQQYLRSFIPNFIVKLFVPSIMATLMAYIAFCVTDGSLSATALKNQVLATGGWYVWATVLMYLFFFVGALIFKDNLRGQLIAQCLMGGAYIVIGKMVLHISSTYYIDCPAFLLGSFVCVYKDKIDRLMNNNPMVLGLWGVLEV